MGIHSWLEENHLDNKTHLDGTLRQLRALGKRFHKSNEVLENSSCCAGIMVLFGVYCEFLRNGNVSLSAFWMSYLDMVDIMLSLI